ncbi:MAG: acetate--CoA ligase family protein [Syntrophales bacterium]
MDERIRAILNASRMNGWVMEPQAKELLRTYGLPTTRFFWAKSLEASFQGAKEVGYPLVVKVVSPDILHKSDVGGVVMGVEDGRELEVVYQRMSRLNGFQGVLLDQMVQGIEMIVGSKEDPQFGTVVVVGIGGTSVEVYKDISIRMAPLSFPDAMDAIGSIKGRRLLEGYRGREPVNIEKLSELIVSFSQLAFDLRDEVESIDLNPVLCDREKAVIADARFVLKNMDKTV